MKKFLSEHFMDAFKIFVAVVVIGIIGGAFFTINEVNAASSSPIQVQYDKTTRHNMKIQVGKTTTNYLSFKLSGKGTINSATWSSSNTSIMTVVSKTGSKGSAKCKFKGIKEGHAVLKLTVKTTKDKKNYTYTESVGISVFTDIKDAYCVSYALPATYVYRGATTEQYEVEPGIGSENRNYAYYNILYQCGGYYYVEKVCEPTWSNGKIVKTVTDKDYMKNIYSDGNVSGFVKKGHVSTSASILVRGIEMSSTDDNYPLNYEMKLTANSTPVNVPVTYKWSSSNTKVATVSSTGQVKTVGPGEAIIKVSYGNYAVQRKIRVTGLVLYDAQSKTLKANDSAEAVKNEMGKPFSYSNLLPTDDVSYGIAYDIKSDSCAVCNTKNRYFESLDMFNTNCYGFVINRWSFCKTSSIANGRGRAGVGSTPGTISGTNKLDSSYTPAELAKMVKSDVEYLGGDATILEGKDNNPNYPTDENHYLIAIRVHKTYYDYDYDYHFMIKKNGEWCFKDGLSGELLKIKDYKTPSNVYWNARYYDLGDGFNATDKDFYRGDIQYMVISKLPVSITLR